MTTLELNKEEQLIMLDGLAALFERTFDQQEFADLSKLYAKVDSMDFS